MARPRRPFGGGEERAVRFDPPHIDEAQAVALVERFANGLAPDAVDEATGHSLDNLINAMADRWYAELRAQYVEYRRVLELRRAHAEAAATKLRALHEHDARRLEEINVAVEAVLHRLGVPDPQENPK